MKNILIADDEKTIRSLIRKTFEEEGYHVTEAENGKVALQKLSEIHADVMIIDIVMPEMDGLELIQAVRQINTEVKIIAISAGGPMRASDCLQAATAFGAQKVIQKPFDIDELVASTRLLTT